MIPSDPLRLNLRPALTSQVATALPCCTETELFGTPMGLKEPPPYEDNTIDLLELIVSEPFRNPCEWFRHVNSRDLGQPHARGR